MKTYMINFYLIKQNQKIQEKNQNFIKKKTKVYISQKQNSSKKFLKVVLISQDSYNKFLNKIKKIQFNQPQENRLTLKMYYKLILFTGSFVSNPITI